MKKLLLLLLATATLGSLAASSLAAPPFQNKPAPKAGPAIGSPEWLKTIHNRVIGTLGLTAAQKKGITAAFDKQNTAQAKLSKDYPYKGPNDPNYKKRMEAMKKINTTFTTEAKKALGAKYDTYMKRMGEEAQKAMGMATPSAAQIQTALKIARARVVKQLGITPAQVKSIEAIEAKAQKDFMALSKQLAGKQGVGGSKAEQDKITASFKKVSDTRLASLKKLLGDKKATDYDKNLQAEMQKEMTKLMSKPSAKPKA